MKTKIVIGLAIAGAAFATRQRLSAVVRTTMAKCAAMCRAGCHAPSAGPAATTAAAAPPG